MSCLRANDCGPTFHVAGGQKTKIHHVSVNINFFTCIELLLTFCNPKLVDYIFAISKIVNKGVPKVTRFVLFENVAPME